MRVLVAGWFSFKEGHATAGDLLTRDVACDWLGAAGFAFDIAVAAPFRGGVDIRRVDPLNYSHLLFVCGPFEQGPLEAEVLSRFSHCRLVGLNLSMTAPLENWSPFDLLIERDSSRAVNADIAFSSGKPLVPVVGVCLVEPHPGASVEIANRAIQRLANSRELAIVQIDTRLDRNETGLKTAGEVESLIAQMSVVLTTRLHGMVLALKNGVPVVVIDPIPGGAKINLQAKAIGWPEVFKIDDLSDEALAGALARCLAPEARRRAKACADRARTRVDLNGKAMIDALKDARDLERSRRDRLAGLSDGIHRLAHETSMNASRDIQGALATERFLHWLRFIARWTLPAPLHCRLKAAWQKLGKS